MAARNKSQAARNLVIIASLFIIAAGLKAAAPLLTPLLISLFFSVLCLPPLQRLKNSGVPDGIAIAIVVIGATIVVLAITAIIGSSLTGFESKLPAYRSELDHHVSDFSDGSNLVASTPAARNSPPRLVRVPFSTS